MKILLDTCVWGGAAQTLIDAGHDVVWAGSWDSDPGDMEVLSIAHREDRVLVTLDKDFGELAVVLRTPHSGILRLVSFSSRQQAIVCAQILRSHGQELRRGAIITAEPGRLRIRPTDAEPDPK